MKIFNPFSLLSQAALCLLLATAAHAQTSTPPGSGGPTPAATVPLDGGASLLLAGGVAYGLKKLRDRRKAG